MIIDSKEDSQNENDEDNKIKADTDKTAYSVQQQPTLDPLQLSVDHTQNPGRSSQKVKQDQDELSC